MTSWFYPRELLFLCESSLTVNLSNSSPLTCGSQNKLINTLFHYSQNQLNQAFYHASFS
ncbi:hypothetical protein LEQ41_08280 [Streptococcus agalactiae]|nr:hypothetical protein [Streptococcus agalactiae]